MLWFSTSVPFISRLPPLYFLCVSFSPSLISSRSLRNISPTQLAIISPISSTFPLANSNDYYYYDYSGSGFKNSSNISTGIVNNRCCGWLSHLDWFILIICIHAAEAQKYTMNASQTIRIESQSNRSWTRERERVRENEGKKRVTKRHFRYM